MKKPIQSRSIWFYSLSLIATVGTALLADENFKSLLGDNIGYVTGLMAVVGIGLRIVTSRPIGYDDNNAVEEALKQDMVDEYGV